VGREVTYRRRRNAIRFRCGLVLSLLVLQVCACGTSRGRDACFAAVEAEANAESDRVIDSGICDGYSTASDCPAWVTAMQKYDAMYLGCP
jgi:hypothetical protein